ncbi:MAG: NAD(P)/FAD-dependent oxidoreductase [Promethearchaeota archaeon]
MSDSADNIDICIIGGSIAGNYLCYLLSKSNLKIAVIEEHDKIGFPLQCAGIISQKLTKLTNIPKNIIQNRVKFANIISPSGKYIRLSGEEQPYVINRIALDRFFYENIKDNNNITYFLNERFKSFKYIVENKKKVILIKTSKRKLKSKILIGCDGSLSSVAKLIGITHKKLYAAQIRIKENRFDQKEVYMFFNPKWKELFGWIVPEGNKICRIGLACSKNIAKNFKTFLTELRIDIKDKIDRQGGIIPYGSMSKTAFDNILLLGDSACQVKATTGGGVIMLLSAAKLAAYCIKRCFKENNFSKKFIRKYYERPCLDTIGKQLKVHYIISIIFETFSTKDFDTFFQIIKTSHIEEIISFYGDMDFPKKLFLRLLKNSMIFKFLAKIIRRNPLLILKIFKIIIKK